MLWLQPSALRITQTVSYGRCELVRMSASTLQKGEAAYFAACKLHAQSYNHGGGEGLQDVQVIIGFIGLVLVQVYVY